MGQTDFTPMCRRDVTIWRDADKAGVDFQDATIAKLQVAGAASIRFVDPDRIPTDMSTRIRENKRHKFDVVDLIEAGISPEAIGEVAERACVAVAISWRRPVRGRSRVPRRRRGPFRSIRLETCSRARRAQ